MITISEQNALLNKIVWGGFYASVKTDEDVTVFLLIKELNLKDRAWVNFINQQAILKSKTSGLMLRGELAILLSKQGLWTSEDDEELERLTQGIKNLDERLELKLSKRDRKQVERAQELVRLNLRKIHTRKNNLFSSSAERYAEEQRLKAIVYCSTKNLEDKNYWTSWDDFQDETDFTIIDNIIYEISKAKDITTSQFRYLARSNSWRFKWQASKNCDDLFGKPIVELSNNQESLIYWSQVYDSVYEAYERPDDDIINDDEALDEWFEEQGKKRKREQLENNRSNSSGSIASDKVWRHGEVGLVSSRALDADLDRARKLGLAAKNTKAMPVGEINELNTDLSKKFLAAQRNKLKKYKVLREEDMRSDPNSRRAIGSTDAILKKQKRSDGFTGRVATQTYDGGTLQGRREND